MCVCVCVCLYVYMNLKNISDKLLLVQVLYTRGQQHTAPETHAVQC